MERAVDGDGIGYDYFRVWQETLVILRLSLINVTTLCLDFKDCTVALFFHLYGKAPFPRGLVPLP